MEPLPDEREVELAVLHRGAQRPWPGRSSGARPVPECQRSRVAGRTRNTDHRSRGNIRDSHARTSRSEGVYLGRAT